MKSRLTLLRSIACCGLFFLCSLITHAGDFKVKVLTSDGQPVEGVSVKYYTWGWMTLGTTNSLGEVAGSLENKTYPLQFSYKRTGLQTSFTVSDGQSEFIFYTSRVHVKAVTYNNTPVPGVVSSFHPSAGFLSFGATGADGVNNLELFPGVLLNFQSTINHTGDEKRDIVVAGDGNAPGVVTNVEVKVVTAHFANKGGARFYASAWRSIPQAADHYIMPGIRRLYFGGGDNISREIDINPANLRYEKTASVIVVKNNQGDFQAPAQMRFGYDAPNVGTVAGSAVGNIQALEGVGRYIHLTDKHVNQSRTYEVRVNNTVKVITQDVITKSVFEYKTNLLVLNVKDCEGNGIAGVTARYQTNSANHWPGGASSNGVLSMEAFPATFGFIEVTVGGSVNQKLNVVFDGSNSVNWTTSRVKFNYPHAIAYGGANGLSAHFNKDSQLLPGKTKFSFRGPGLGENVVELDIPEGCVYEKTPVVLRLLASNGSPISGASGEYYQTSWKNAETETKANGNAIALLNGNVSKASVALTYLGGREQKSNVSFSAVQNIVVFQTVVVTATLEDNAGEPINGNGLQYYAGQWRDFGNGLIDNGAATFELLPVSYSFGVRLNGSRQQISNQNISANPVVSFVAKKVFLSLKNGEDQGIDGGSGSFYAQSWQNIGVTDSDGLTPFVYLLPGGEYTFKMKKGTFDSSRKVALEGTDDLVVNFTDPNASVAAARLAFAGEQPEINVYPNPSADRIDIRAFSGNTTLEIYSNSGRRLHQMSSVSGFGSLDISKLPKGIYTVIVRDGKVVKSKRIIKD